MDGLGVAGVLIEGCVSLAGGEEVVVLLLVEVCFWLLLECCHLLFYSFVCKTVCALEGCVFYLLLGGVVF